MRKGQYQSLFLIFLISSVAIFAGIAYFILQTRQANNTSTTTATTSSTSQNSFSTSTTTASSFTSSTIGGGGGTGGASSATIASTTTISPPPSGLAGYWKFDEGAGIFITDSSGNGNTGSLASCPAWVSGRFGNALNYSGSGSSTTREYVVDVSDSNSIDVDVSTGFTVGAWVNPSSYVCTAILRKNGQFELYRCNGVLGGITIRVWTPSQTDRTGSVAIQNGQWSYLVATNNKTHTKLYVNGVLDNTWTDSGTPSSTTNDLGIGAYTSGQYSFNGIIDEVQIWNRSLTADEIDQLYHLTPSPATTTTPATNPVVSVCPTGQSGCDYSGDGSAIQTAICSLPPAGGTVKIAAGTFETKTIWLKSNVKLIGSGIGKTVIHSSVLNPTYSIIFAPSGNANIEIASMTIDGNANQHTVSEAKGVGILSRNVSVHDLEVMNAGDNGIETNGVRTFIYNNTIHTVWANGIYTNGASNVSIYNNTVYNASLTGVIWDGIDVDPYTNYTDVYNNIVIGNDIIVYNDGPKNSMHDITVKNNQIINSIESGIDLAGNVNNILVSGNIISNVVVGYGILINGPVADSTITGNIFNQTQADGIMFWGQPSNIEIANNQFLDAGSQPNLYSGITITGFASNVYIHDNTFSDSRQPPVTLYSISISSQTTNVTLDSNTLIPGRGVNYVS